MKYIINLLSVFIGLNLFAAEPVHVRIETNKGNIEIELSAEKAPITVANFLHYVDTKFYDGTIFHRVVKNFVVQGGGLTPDMVEKPTEAPIKCESPNGLSNVKGTIAMAREDAPDTATAQFYFNLKDNLFLNYQAGDPDHYGYAVFGTVTSGLDIIEAMQDVPTKTIGEYDDVPVDPIVILSVVRDVLPYVDTDGRVAQCSQEVH